MTKNSDRVLPLDFDSDYSLPGRFEESNSPIIETIEERTPSKNKGLWIIAVSFVIIAAGFFSYYIFNQDEIDSKIIQNTLITDPEAKLVRQYDVGKYGSEHSHAALAVFINNQKLDFSLPPFQLASKYIHFENNNSYLIHKHAKGVPLEMLFSSLGMKISNDCLMWDYLESGQINTRKFCADEKNNLMFYVNGKAYDSEISQFVFKHDDQILISYGSSDSIPFQLEYLESLKIFDIPKKIPSQNEQEIII